MFMITIIIIITICLTESLIKCTALDSDDLLYLKEQMEAEEDAERLRRRTEKRAFAAFKISSSPLCITFLEELCNITGLAVRAPIE